MMVQDCDRSVGNYLEQLLELWVKDGRQVMGEGQNDLAIKLGVEVY